MCHPLCLVQLSHPGEPWLGPEEEDGSGDATRGAGRGGGHSNGCRQKNRKGNEGLENNGLLDVNLGFEERVHIRMCN